MTDKDKQKKYYEENKEYKKEYSREYYRVNKERYKETYQKNKEYNEEHYDKKKDIEKDICKKCNVEKFIGELRKDASKKKGYKNICKECINKNRDREYLKKYAKENKDKINEYNKKYNKERRKTDDLFRLSGNIRGLINSSIRKNGYLKKSKTTKILGCSFEEFKNHLESKFEDWMNWDNYGLYNGDLNYGWDIDHIIPVASVGCETKLIFLNHYTNLQPLCSKINRDIKRDNIE